MTALHVHWPRLVPLTLLSLMCAFVPWVVLHFQALPPLKTYEKCLNNTNKSQRDNVVNGFTSKPRLVNSLLSDYDEKTRRTLQTLARRKARSLDPDVTSFVRTLLDPPSDHMVKLSHRVLRTPQAECVENILKQQRSGFFIECGALDGERSSNTLYLEQRLGWTGVLIEMDPYFYTQLRGKNRDCYSINACLSPYDYVTEVMFEESTCGMGRLLLTEGESPAGPHPRGEGPAGPHPPGQGPAGPHPLGEGPAGPHPPGQGPAGPHPRPASNNETVSQAARDVSTPTRRLVPCVPLVSLLAAVGQHRVDYLSLDVEGLELEILKSIPWSTVDIRVLSVEYKHGALGKQAYRDFMEGQGYVTYSDIVYKDYSYDISVMDFIFVKK